MKHHPEQRDDEIYMGNSKLDDVLRSSWRSSRLGNVALCMNGSPVYITKDDNRFGERLRPWFITLQEVQYKIESLRNFTLYNVDDQIELFQKMVDTRTVFDRVPISI